MSETATTAVPRTAAALRKPHSNMPKSLASRFIGFHPGEGVIYDDPEIVSFMAEDAGVFDPDVTPNGAIRYRDDDAVDGAKVEIEGGAVPCVDAERAARKLVRQQQAFSVLGAALNADLQTVIRFLKGMTHGAIRRGLTPYIGAASARQRSRSLASEPPALLPAARPVISIDRVWRQVSLRRAAFLIRETCAR